MRHTRANVDYCADVSLYAEQLFKAVANLRDKILLPLQSSLQYWFCSGCKSYSNRMVDIRKRLIL